MNKNDVTIGIDKQEGTYFVARVDHHTGRPDIKALIRFDADHFNGHHLLEGNKIVISLPDKTTTVKQIHLQSHENSLEKVRFELENSIIDTTDCFLFDIIPTELKNYYLGLSVRKEIAQRSIEPFIKQNGDQSYATGGVMRAVALARGFLTYCQQSGGDFGAIIEFGTKSASIAFYYKRQIIDIDNLPLQTSYYQNSNNFQKMKVELKTLLNYKIASLLEKGISIPLSKIYVIGEFLDENLIDSLHLSLKVDISRPDIHTGFISNKNENNDIPLDKYLVALGLTVV